MSTEWQSLPHPQEPPDQLTKLYADWQWTVAWAFVPSSAVYRLAKLGGPTLFVKIRPRDRHVTLTDEAKRLRWASTYVSVPRVVDLGTEGGLDWLVLGGLPGKDATGDVLRSRPEHLVAALGRGLRRFHELAPVQTCPFDFRLDTAIHQVQERASEGVIDHGRDFHYEHLHFSIEDAVDVLLRDRPSTEDLVVCHGDYCFPNALIEDGEVTGYIDLGELGVADRWWDLAVATWSTTWNLGPGYESILLDAYGIQRDESRIRYYRLLYDLAS